MANRRQFFTTTLSLIVPTFLSTKTNIVVAKAENIANLHEKIAQYVRSVKKQNSNSLTLLYPMGCLDNLKPITKAFNEMTGVNITLREVVVDNINTHILLESAQGRYSFDVALPATFGLPELIEANTLSNLDQYAKKYQPNSYQQQSLYSLGDYYKGSLYGYQTDGDAYVMFYKKSWLEDEELNKKFLDQHGYSLKIPTTWQELDTMMKFFHDPEAKRYGGCLFRSPDYVHWEWWLRFHAKGSYPFDDNMQALIDSDAGIQALEELISATAYLHPKSKVNGLFENWKTYSEGNVFCNIGWGGSQKYLQKQALTKNDMLYGLTPGIKNGESNQPISYFNWGWNYVVSKLSPNQEIAYLFTLFACSPTISTLSVRQAGGYFDPFRENHYIDEEINQIYTAEFLEVHKSSMENSIPDLYLQGQADYFGALKENIQLALRGTLSAEKALNLTAKQWSNISNNIGKGSQQKQWRFLKQQYPKNIRKLLQ